MKKKNSAENVPKPAAAAPVVSAPVVPAPVVPKQADSTSADSTKADSTKADSTSVSSGLTGSASGDTATTQSGVAADKQKPTSRKAAWPRLTVMVLFALVYAYDLFEAISATFLVTAQITKYNAERVLNGLNTVAIPWVVLILALLVPIAVYFLALLFARKRNIGILALALLAGLGVVAALSLSLDVFAGVLAG